MNCDPTAAERSEIFVAIQVASRLDAQGMTGRAIAAMDALAKVWPSVGGIRVYLCWYLRRGEYFDEAIKQGLLAIQMLPRSSYASLVMFQALWDAGEKAEAIAEIRRFLPLRRSKEKTPHYEEILRRWDAGDRAAADRVVVTLNKEDFGE